MLFTGSCQAITSTRVAYAGSEWNALIQDPIEGDRLKKGKHYRVVGRNGITVLVERQAYNDKLMTIPAQ